jgi:hypothetical protein
VPSRREGPPDPLGKRALFWVPSAQVNGDSGSAGAATVALPLGKSALYSGARVEEPGDSVDSGTPGTHRGTVKVECQRCGGVSSIGLLDLLRLQLPVGIWLPRGRFDRRMTCPTCRTRSWCSVTLRRS